MGSSVSVDTLVAVPLETTPVRRAAVLLALEAVVLLVVGVVFAIATAAGEPDNRGLAFGVAGFAVAGGVVLLLLARAIDRSQGWARSPALVLQLLALPVGIGFLQGRHWAVGVPVLLVAVVTLWHVLRSGVDD